MYPPEFPAESAIALADYLRGNRTAPLPALIEHAWFLTGYGLKLGVGDGKPALMQSANLPSDEDAASQLMRLSTSAAHGVAPLAGALPGWIVPFAIGLFQRLLEEWQKA